GRQAIKLSGFGAQPLAILVGAVLGHANRGKSVLAHAEAHLHIGPGGVGDYVCNFISVFVSRDAVASLFFLIWIHEQLVLIPGDFAAAHPEWRNFYLMLWSLIVLARGFGGGAAHDKLASMDRNHCVRDWGARNGVGVRLHIAFIGHRPARNNAAVN